MRFLTARIVLHRGFIQWIEKKAKDTGVNHVARGLTGGKRVLEENGAVSDEAGAAVFNAVFIKERILIAAAKDLADFTPWYSSKVELDANQIAMQEVIKDHNKGVGSDETFQGIVSMSWREVNPKGLASILRQDKYNDVKICDINVSRPQPTHPALLQRAASYSATPSGRPCA